MDGKANVIESYLYDAFGNLLERTSGTGSTTVKGSFAHFLNDILYAGEQYDEVTETYYLRARNYSPAEGRFISEDKYHGDGRNLYAYVRNNPLRYIDPSGYCKEKTGFFSKLVNGVKDTLGNIGENIDQFVSGAVETIGGSLDVLLGATAAATGIGVLASGAAAGLGMTLAASVGVILGPALLVAAGTVAAVGLVVGGVALVAAGVSDAAEGVQNVVYAASDSDKQAVNLIRDNMFEGHEDDYYLMEAMLSCGLSEVSTVAQYSNATYGTGNHSAKIITEDDTIVSNTDTNNGGTPEGYYQDKNSKWHRPNGQFASNEEVGISSKKEAAASATLGGRLGNEATRNQNKLIADHLSNNGYEIIGGGTYQKEEYLKGPDGKRKGSNYVDITAEKDGYIIRINTVDVDYAGNPTQRELEAANSINKKTGGKIILIPKGEGIGNIDDFIQ